MFWAAIILSEAVTRGVLWKRNPCQSLFFNKVTCLRSATLLKKRLRCRCFPTNFVKFLITPFPTEHLRWLPLFCYFYSDQRFINPLSVNDEYTRIAVTFEIRYWRVYSQKNIMKCGQLYHLAGNLHIVATLTKSLLKYF